MLNSGPNYTIKVFRLVAIVWGAIKPLANYGVPKCTGANKNNEI